MNSADRAALERILAQSGVDRTPAAPSWLEYLEEVVTRVATAIAAAIEAFWQRFAGPDVPSLEEPLLVLAIAILVSAVYLVARTLVLDYLRSRRAPTAPPRVAPVAARDQALRDASAWRSALEAHLARGDVAAALEALWWWLARTLLAERALASWTSRELLTAAARNDLGGLAGRLDEMLYGPVPPAPGEVRVLLERLEKALP